jgi:hypothetical protein
MREVLLGVADIFSGVRVIRGARAVDELTVVAGHEYVFVAAERATGVEIGGILHRHGADATCLGSNFGTNGWS